MLGKLIREAAEVVGEVVAAPLTVANEVERSISREVDRLADPKPEKPERKG